MKAENFLDYISEDEEIVFIDCYNNRHRVPGQEYILANPEMDVLISTKDNQICLYSKKTKLFGIYS